MNRIELKSGTKMDVNGVTYEIVNYINRGGSALVYEVISVDSNRSKKTVLKEFYPQNSHRKEDGSEVVPDSGIAKKDFEAWKERFISEGVKSGNAGNITYQVLHIEHVDSEKAIMVMAMTSEDMKPLTELLEEWEEHAPESDDDYSETGRVRYALKIVSSLLSGLSAIHNKANLLHGDITPGNLFWAGQNIETGLHCETFFLDFGCAQCFDIDKNVVIPDEDHDFGATSGYGAPEKYLSEFPMILRPSYDLYAVTALLAVLCFGKKICLHGSWQPVNLYQFKNREIKNQLKNYSLNTGTKKELERILCKGLSRYPENRYQSAMEMQEEIEILLKLMWPKKFQLACKARDAISGFVGREKELSQLETLFTKGVHCIFITGNAGIGKTEFALWSAFKFKEKYTTYQVTYGQDLRETILRIPVYGMEDTKFADNEALYYAKLECLREYSSSNILMIDNFDYDSEEQAQIFSSQEYLDLMRIDMRIIFTSRTYPGVSENVIVLDEMKEAELLDVVRYYYKTPCNDEILMKLIREVAFHTLTVEIMAKTMENSWGTVTPEILMAKFREKEIHETICEHLSVLFDLSRLNRQAKEIMSQAVFFPQGGIRADIYLNMNPEDAMFARLIEQSGWLKKDSNNQLLIHPLIREVCTRELNLEESGRKFVQRYVENYVSWEHEKKVEQQYEAVEIISNGVNYLESTLQDLCIAAKWNYDLGRFKEAARYEELALEKAKAVNSNDLKTIIEIEEFLSTCYLKLLDYEKAKKVSEEMIEQARNVYEEESIEYAKYMHQLANIYHAEGFYQTAEKLYMHIARVYDEKEMDLSHKLALWINMAKLYSLTGEHLKGKETCEKVINALSAVDENNWNEAAVIYLTYSVALMEEEQYETALQYAKKAVEIYLYWCGKNHPRLAKAYLNIGCILQRQHKYAEAEESIRQSVQIREKVYGTKNGYVMESYYILAGLYNEMNEYEKALPYLVKAFTICRKYQHILEENVFRSLAFTYKAANRKDEDFDAWLIPQMLKILKDWDNE